MPTLTNLVSTYINRYSKYTRIILVVVILIIFISLGYYAYNKYGKVMLEKQEMKDVANSQNSTKSVEMIFFFAEWCPHCKTAKPIWEKVSNDYNSKVVNGYKLNFSVVNCTNGDDADVQVAINKYKVEHFPTIKLLKDNDTIEFDSKISEENLIKFFNIILKE